MAADELTDANLKIERAKEKIADLEIAGRTFNSTNPYKIVANRDPHTRKPIYSMASIADVPRNISLLAGEVIHDLRSALDYLAYRLFNAGLYRTDLPFDRIYFPIFDDAATHIAKLPGIISTSRHDVADAINALQPYKGGNGHSIWAVNKLNNIDKHRMLITAVAAFHSLDARALFPTQEMFMWYLMKVAKWTPGGLVLPTHFHLIPPGQQCPLKVGDVIFEGDPDQEINPNLDFRFSVTLNEPGILDCKPILETLGEFTDFVSYTISAFDNFFT